MNAHQGQTEQTGTPLVGTVRARTPLWTRLTRAAGRTALSIQYALTQRHRHRRLTIERVGSFQILVLPEVFNPVLFKTGAFLAEVVEKQLIPSGARVLDMGTGSGIGAIAAAERGAHVVAVDVNPEAVRCTRINLLLNRLEERVDVRRSDLFEAMQVGETFDVVLFNPPYFRGEPVDHYDHAWRSRDAVERFADGLDRYLAEEGRACLVLSSDGESEVFLNAFAQNGFEIRSLARRDYINESLTVYEIKRNG